MSRRRRLACLLLAGAALAAPASAHAQAPTGTVRAIGVSTPLTNERLSDERKVTRYAGVLTRSSVLSEPRTGSRRVGRLHFLTEDGPFEVYLVLSSHVDSTGAVWLHVRLPGRPNGRSGWVPRRSLGALKVVRTALRVNRTTLRATLRRDGRVIWSSRIGVGKSSTPTPVGHFWVRTRLRSLASNPSYGPYAFGTSDYSVLSDWPGGGVIGIHGTDEPQLIPGRPSHGCVRLPNAAIKRLWKLMPVGTPVDIVGR